MEHLSKVGYFGESILGNTHTCVFTYFLCKNSLKCKDVSIFSFETINY